MAQKQNKAKEIIKLKEEIDELTKAKLDSVDLNDLEAQIDKLMNEEKIVSNVKHAYEILEEIYQNQSLYDASSLKKISDYDPLYLKASEVIFSSHYELENIRRT